MRAAGVIVALGVIGAGAYLVWKRTRPQTPADVVVAAAAPEERAVARCLASAAQTILLLEWDTVKAERLAASRSADTSDAARDDYVMGKLAGAVEAALETWRRTGEEPTLRHVALDGSELLLRCPAGAEAPVVLERARLGSTGPYPLSLGYSLAAGSW